MATHSADVHIRADEPATDGHFPGNPIVPAAVLLREVLRVLAPDGEAPDGEAPDGEAPDGEAPDGEAVCREIRSARFFRPVRPGDRLTVRWDTQAAGDTAFDCSSGADGHRVLSGVLCMRSR